MKVYTHPTQLELFILDMGWTLTSHAHGLERLARARGFLITTELNLVDSEGELSLMARRKSTKQGTNGQTSIGDWNGFATIALTDADKAEINKYVVNWEHVEDVIAQLLFDDYKVTLKWDTQSDCYMLSASCYDAESPNFKYTLVTRATNLHILYATLAYKHEIIARGVWVSNDRKDVWG